MILMKIRVLFRPIENEDLIKTLIFIKIIKYVLITWVCFKKYFLRPIQILWSHYIKMMGTLLTLGLYSHQSKTLWSIAYFFISLNTTLMLIMFPSFSHDGTKEFGSAVKKSIL